MIQHLAQIVGLGLETATLLVREMFCRPFRDRRAVASFAGLTGTPFRSGGMEREQRIGKQGNARVRRIVMQLAWRSLRFQPQSALAQWFAARPGGAKGRLRTVMIVALARKLLVAPCSGRRFRGLKPTWVDGMPSRTMAARRRHQDWSRPPRLPSDPADGASWYGADRFGRIRVCRPSGLSTGEPPRMVTGMTVPLHHSSRPT